MTIHKGFQINESTTPKVFGVQEDQTLRAVIDTIVTDTLQVTSASSGHYHNKLYATSGGVIALSATSTGNVGIGATPANKLQVAGDIAIDGAYAFKSLGGNNIQFSSDSGAVDFYSWTPSFLRVYNPADTTYPPISFAATTNGASWVSTDLANGTLGGNFGVGTNNPTTKLHVSGNCQVVGKFNVSNYAAIGSMLNPSDMLVVGDIDNAASVRLNGSHTAFPSLFLSNNISGGTTPRSFYIRAGYPSPSTFSITDGGTNQAFTIYTKTDSAVNFFGFGGIVGMLPKGIIDISINTGGVAAQGIRTCVSNWDGNGWSEDFDNSNITIKGRGTLGGENDYIILDNYGTSFGYNKCWYGTLKIKAVSNNGVMQSSNYELYAGTCGSLQQQEIERIWNTNGGLHDFISPRVVENPTSTTSSIISLYINSSSGDNYADVQYTFDGQVM